MLAHLNRPFRELLGFRQAFFERVEPPAQHGDGLIALAQLTLQFFDRERRRLGSRLNNR